MTLKPCPFCGCESPSQWAPGSTVCCPRCNAEGPMDDEPGFDPVQAWNERTQPKEPT